MLKQVPERITYAQGKIIQLEKERKLRQWCMENVMQILKESKKIFE